MAQASSSHIPVFERLVGQDQVRSYLESAVESNKVSHAYLFVGPAGCGQMEAALALAKALVCHKGGCNACEECIRVDRGSHPDVRQIKPEGAAGYVVEQVRELISEVSLTPVRANYKVYILESVETLTGTCANALLKTIEEPPEGVVFILMARTLDAVLPTISSRCQCVPFRVSNQDDAVRRIALASGVDNQELLRIALSIVGTPEKAVSWIRSAERQNARRSVLRAFGGLPRDDSWDILCAASDVLEAYGIKKKDKKKKAEATLTPDEEREKEIQSEFLSAKAVKILEQRAKRETTAAQRAAMIESIAVAQSLLRDVLARACNADEAVVNTDSMDVIDRLAKSATPAAALSALDACERAASNLSHNVTLQLIWEVMLLHCKEALCPPSFR